MMQKGKKAALAHIICENEYMNVTMHAFVYLHLQREGQKLEEKILKIRRTQVVNSLLAVCIAISAVQRVRMKS